MRVDQCMSLALRQTFLISSVILYFACFTGHYRSTIVDCVLRFITFSDLNPYYMIFDCVKKCWTSYWQRQKHELLSLFNSIFKEKKSFFEFILGFMSYENSNFDRSLTRKVEN